MPDSLSKLAYQVSPIFLTGGIATQLRTGGILPLLWLTNRYGDSVSPYNVRVPGLPPLPIVSFDDVFGTFNVNQGGTLIDQAIATYPFASQSIAGNATIRNPLSVSVTMDTPMRTLGGTADSWSIKFSIMSALKATLDSHNNLGGTYTLFTPAFMYTNLILKNLTDVSRTVSANNQIPQNSWKFEFERPLVSMEELTQAYSLNYMMLSLANGIPATTLQTGQQTGPQVGVQVGQTGLLDPLLTYAGMVGFITSTSLGPGNAPTLNMNYGGTPSNPTSNVNISS